MDLFQPLTKNNRPGPQRAGWERSLAVTVVGFLNSHAGWTQQPTTFSVPGRFGSVWNPLSRMTWQRECCTSSAGIAANNRFMMQPVLFCANNMFVFKFQGRLSISSSSESKIHPVWQLPRPQEQRCAILSKVRLWAVGPVAKWEVQTTMEQKPENQTLMGQLGIHGQWTRRKPSHHPSNSEELYIFFWKKNWCWNGLLTLQHFRQKGVQGLVVLHQMRLP